VKEKDLEEFFERSKNVRFRVECSSCGKRIVSVLGIGAACEVCGAPICIRCAEVRGIRRCSEHERRDEGNDREKEEE